MNTLAIVALVAVAALVSFVVGFVVGCKAGAEDMLRRLGVRR